VPQTGSSPAMLKVDRESVPQLRKVFDRALARLDVQIDLAISGVRVSPWAGDPVSDQAAHDFNQHTVDGRDSAVAALYAYQRQLKSASDALTRVAREYDIVESDTTSTFGG
jgi:hypothetical protein